MTNKTITIDQIEYPVDFDLSTICAFEQTANKSFFDENFERLYYRAIFIWAAIFTVDDSIKIDIVLKSKDWKGINQAFADITNMASDFFKVPDVVKQAEDQESESSEETDKEKQQKN